MSDQLEVALGFLRQHINELELIQSQAKKAVNAILAKEQFQKWKKHSLVMIGQKVGETYSTSLRQDWLEGTFPGSDMYDELEDDIEMCLRHLKRLLREVETQGLSSQA